MLKKHGKILLSALLTLGLFCLVVSAAWAETEKFYSEEGQFKIAFEGEPRDFRQDQDSEFGKMVWVAYAYQSLDYLALILYCDLPRVMTLGLSSQTLLKQVGEGMAEGDTILSEESVKIAGIKGMKYVTVKNDEYTKRIFLMSGQRIYIFGVQTTEDLIDSPQVEDFLNSFELVTY